MCQVKSELLNLVDDSTEISGAEKSGAEEKLTLGSGRKRKCEEEESGMCGKNARQPTRGQCVVIG